MQTDQLRALLAVVDEGTFDAAARALHITPSAVSQRIRALENAIGGVVVRRSTPVTATATGEVLLRLARQHVVLEQEALAELEQTVGPAHLDIAVNADSLATWMRDVLAVVGSWGGVALKVYLEDQAHSHELLRAGTVMGAITSNPVPVQGSSVQPLGSMRYVPVATPTLREQFSRGRSVDWAHMPALRFNELDELQREVLRRHGVEVDPPTSWIPSSEGFADAVRAGLGWGMLPLLQCREDLTSGRLVRLHARDHADVSLYWQSWRLRSALMERFTQVLLDHAP